MKSVQLADIDAAARVLMCCPQSTRPRMVAQMLAQAETADKYRRRLRKPHPQFGSGTLMSVAVKYPQAVRVDCFDDDALDAFSHVIKALIVQKAHHSL